MPELPLHRDNVACRLEDAGPGGVPECVRPRYFGRNTGGIDLRPFQRVCVPVGCQIGLCAGGGAFALFSSLNRSIISSVIRTTSVAGNRSTAQAAATMTRPAARAAPKRGRRAENTSGASSARCTGTESSGACASWS